MGARAEFVDAMRLSSGGVTADAKQIQSILPRKWAQIRLRQRTWPLSNAALALPY